MHASNWRCAASGVFSGQSAGPTAFEPPHALMQSTSAPLKSSVMPNPHKSFGSVWIANAEQKKDDPHHAKRQT
jgi:hypothetical protein